MHGTFFVILSVVTRHSVSLSAKAQVTKFFMFMGQCIVILCQ